jgi:hypothetical protein
VCGLFDRLRASARPAKPDRRVTRGEFGACSARSDVLDVFADLSIARSALFFRIRGTPSSDVRPFVWSLDLVLAFLAACNGSGRR